MYRFSCILLATLLAVSWADDLYASIQTPDPSDDTCTETDLVLAPTTGEDCFNEHLRFAHASAVPAWSPAPSPPAGGPAHLVKTLSCLMLHNVFTSLRC